MSNLRMVVEQAEQEGAYGLSEVPASSWVGLASEMVYDAVMTAAVLTSTAFRMRDDGALVPALRNLAVAVAELELCSSNGND